jgi:TrmH family RNA methyltransferase
VEPVRSARNPRVAEAIRLQRARRRAETGRTLLEGPHLLAEALAAGAALETVFVCDDEDTGTGLIAGLERETVVVTPPVMAKLAGTQHPRGPVAVMAIPPDRPARQGSVIVSWGVGDPGNAGTLIRSAAAFGLAYLSGPGSADPWSPKVLRAGAGAHFRTGIERLEILSVHLLRDRGFTVVAAVVAGGAPPEHLAGIERCALLVGHESAGLPPAVVEAADRRITIRMPGRTESLNAGVAGSLLAYEWAKTAEDPSGRD